MLPTRILIVDDEPLARERIRTLLAERTDVETVGECRDGQEAVEAIHSLAPDLVFLDVQMPELDGFGVIEAVGAEAMPAVIFVTAYDQHALRAFEVHALDYLLKPFDIERFNEALDRALRLLDHRSDAVSQKLARLLDDLGTAPSHLDRLMIKSRARIYFVRVDEIDWIEAAGNYLRLHTGTDTHLLRQTMTRMEDQLDPNQFIRIHRSTIVNVDRVKELQSLFSGDYEVTLTDGTKLTLSRSYRDRLDRFAQ